MTINRLAVVSAVVCLVTDTIKLVTAVLGLFR